MPSSSPADIVERLIVQSGVAPGGSVAAAVHRDGAWRILTGAAGRLGASSDQVVKENTVYDLASVTKPIIALTLARLVETGRVSFTTPLGDLLEEARGTPSERLPLELLLSHRSGLEAHLPLFAPLCRGEPMDRSLALKMAANGRRSDCLGAPSEQGFVPLYSDLGYLLLGEAICRSTRTALDELVEQEVNQPLGTKLRSVRLWRHDPSFSARVAPSEVVAWRGGEIVGQIHDENAFALVGDGSAGNAGLFSAAADVAKLGMRVLDVVSGRDRSWLSHDTLEVLTRPRHGGTLRAGFDGKALENSSAGQLFSNRSFGHLGFTGTSWWCDPEAQVVVVVLSNRVSPTRDNVLHKRYRPLLHDALFRAVTEA
jgi:CubicO group peptidase (beta-lactamase class C family)